MNGLKISELTLQNTLDGTEELVYAKGGANYKVNITGLRKDISANLTGKQDTLVSGTNIKTINGTSILGSGNIEIQSGTSVNVVDGLQSTSATDALSANQGKVLKGLIDGKQPAGDYALKSAIPSTAGLATKAELNKKADKTSVTDHGTADVKFALTPNIFHKWGEVASLNLTLTAHTDNTIVNEYMFQFTSGTTPTTLTLPADVKWIGSNTVEASKTYQVSILNNLAVMGGA